ncbi:MAG: hypothetical protein ABWW69_07895 [Pyrodictiaceae archaeon]
MGAGNIARLGTMYDPSLVPKAIFSDPEVAGVGVSAQRGIHGIWWRDFRRP